MLVIRATLLLRLRGRPQIRCWELVRGLAQRNRGRKTSYLDAQSPPERVGSQFNLRQYRASDAGSGIVRSITEGSNRRAARSQSPCGIRTSVAVSAASMSAARAVRRSICASEAGHLFLAEPVQAIVTRIDRTRNMPAGHKTSERAADLALVQADGIGERGHAHRRSSPK